MAIRVTILKGLEKRLREANTDERRALVVGEVIKLLDDAYTKRETSDAKVEGDLDYRTLVSLFRSCLGDALALPPKPAESWVIKNVALAKNMGVTKDNVEQICRGLRARYPRGPYALGFILYQADVLYSSGRTATEVGVVGRTDEREQYGQSRVYTGRADLPRGPGDHNGEED